MLVLAMFTVGLLAHTLQASHLEQHQCEENFYKHTLPQHIVHSGLEKKCHGPVGRSYISLYHPGCQASVYTALHLSHSNGWGKGEKAETWSGEGSKVFIPALYKRDRDRLPFDTLSPLQKVDSLTAELVESQIIPLCSKGGGEVYVQSGVGRLSECEAEVLWTAVCCTAPDGATSFSMGMVLEKEDNVKIVSMEELEKLVGIGKLFSGECGQGVDSHKKIVTMSKEGLKHVQVTSKKADPDETSKGGHLVQQIDEEKGVSSSKMQTSKTSTEQKKEESETSSVHLKQESKTSNEHLKQESETSTEHLRQESETSTEHLRQESETSTEHLKEESETSTEHLKQVSKPSTEHMELTSETSHVEESVIEQSLSETQTVANNTEPSESVLLFILSSSFSLLCAPLSPIVSTLTNLPSQITYVLQEDAAVLAALPRDSLIVGRDIVCGVASGVENVWDILYQVVETGVGSAYFCIKTLLGTLLLSCQEGVIGTGTLMSDALGLATGTSGQVLEMGSSLVGSVGYGVVGYLGTMGWEMGHQVRKTGGGITTLLWRSQRGLGHLLRTVGAVVRGVLENAVENVQEAFEGTESAEENVQDASTGTENMVENVQDVSAGTESVVEKVQEVSGVVENAGQTV